MTAVVFPVNAVTGAPEYDGRMLRQLQSPMLGPAPDGRPLGATSGVRAGTPASTISVDGFEWTLGIHSGVLDKHTSALAGAYTYAIVEAETGDIDAAHSTNPRIDILTVKVDDPAEADGSTVPALVVTYKAGTAAGSPVQPTPDSTREMIVARFNVPASGGGDPTATWVAPTSGMSESQPATLEVFESSGTWNKPDGLLFARVRVVGGGGGSGGAVGGTGMSAGACGGGGEYAESIIEAGSLGSSETVTVGAGGTAGATGTNPGGNGGASSFGSHVIANGGEGGIGGALSTSNRLDGGGLGGTGGTGQILIPGTGGGAGIVVDGNNLVSRAVSFGGPSHLSPATARNSSTINEPGRAGLKYGGGAAGAQSSSVDQPGAAGASGVVIVECFF